MKLVCVFLIATIAFPGDWQAVQRISPDERIEVVTRRERTRGTLVAADEAVLVMRSRQGEQSFARSEIQRVRVADPSRRVRNGLLGTAIGAGVGLAIGGAICPQCANEGSGGKFAGPLAAAGAGGGAFAGFLPLPYRTVYKR